MPRKYDPFVEQESGGYTFKLLLQEMDDACSRGAVCLERLQRIADKITGHQFPNETPGTEDGPALLHDLHNLARWQFDRLAEGLEYIESLL